MLLNINLCNLYRALAYIKSHHILTIKIFSKRNGNITATGPHIQNSKTLSCIRIGFQKLQNFLNQHFGLGTRDKNPFINKKIQTIKLFAVSDITDRLTIFNPIQIFFKKINQKTIHLLISMSKKIFLINSKHKAKNNLG